MVLPNFMVEPSETSSGAPSPKVHGLFLPSDSRAPFYRRSKMYATSLSVSASSFGCSNQLDHDSLKKVNAADRTIRAHVRSSQYT